MGGPSNVTTTTNQSPPAYLADRLGGASGWAEHQARYRNGPGQAGGRILPNSQGLVNDTIQGNYLNANPYLDQTFQNAANATRTQLSSEFAGSGRDLGAALPARSDQLQNLAAQIYGGNYQMERDRQISAVDQGQALDPLNRYINQLAGIIPGAGGTVSSTQPVFRGGLFSDRRLKRNIQRIGTVSGYPWYSFDYVWGQSAEGVMADEVPMEYVGEMFGYKTVDYARLLGG